ncbi:DnaJ domain protein [Dirofilaria immitis]|nr:DnaJ domain protein [Dirofilaria immitis]
MGDSSDFERFYSDLKETEKRDSVLTSKQQIDRLLRPGSTYLNLNPFEVTVLQIDPDTDVETAKKKYKSSEKAMKIIEDPDELARCRETYTEARARLAIIMSEKRRKQKKNGQGDKIPEDEPAAYNKALWVVVTKAKDSRGNACSCRKRKREEEFAKNYEESRDERRGTWRQFMAKKQRKNMKGNH